jgi:hypothetical protein
MQSPEQTTSLEQLWKRVRFTRGEIEDVLARARLSKLQAQWADAPEAMRLTLAALLLKVTRGQARVCREVTAAEHRKVLRASRALASAIKKLERLDGAPPPMLIERDGRSPWELWARSGRGLSPLGRPARSDHEAVGQFVAFYQIALGLEKPAFSGHHDAPLTRFVRACFECGEARLVRWQQRNGFLDRPHSLYAPKPAALRGQVERLGENKRNIAEVRGQFEGYLLVLNHPPK